MSYQVFARKYRPSTFEDVIGQDHVVQTLRNAIEQKRLAHAYLFVGPRGTGKTSTARIFAKALNCVNGPSVAFDPEDEICREIAEGRALDVVEIDGASNNGVDQVRSLQESAQYSPSVGRFKIFYIDEVHMLSKGAFNALLKILEEPPEHVKFIFATTEVNKVLPTILSRCQRFDLKPISVDLIAKQLEKIAELEGFVVEPSAAWAIAKGADGGMRDAQSMLDQLVAFCGERITEADVIDIFGFTSREKVASLITGLFAREIPSVLGTVQQEAEAGRDLGQLLVEMTSTLRTLLVAKLNPAATSDGIPEEIWKHLLVVAQNCPPDRLLVLLEIFAQAEQNLRYTSNQKLHVELAFIKAVQSLSEVRISDVIETLVAGAKVFPEQAEVVKVAEISPEVVKAVPEIISPEVKVERVAVVEEISREVKVEEREKRVEEEIPEEFAGNPDFVTLYANAVDEREEPEVPVSVVEDEAPWATGGKPRGGAEEEKKVEAAPAAAVGVNEDDFYQDPLIAAALEIFEAKISRA